jgi:hypothetical protein
MVRDDDFQILNPPKPPLWRDPTYRARRARRNFVVGVVSVLCATVALLPPKNGFGEPLSFQIARGEAMAWTLFVLMGCTVLAAVPTLLRVRRYASSAFCGLVVLGLWGLSASDPRSSIHLFMFFYLALMILAWAWGLAVSLEDTTLFCLSGFATLAALSCLFSFGIGERLMMFSALGVLNRILLSDLLE